MFSWRRFPTYSGGKLLDENFLMAIATVGAFVVGEYTEGVAVMVFYQVGELFEHYAVERSRRSITELMDIRPDYANVLRDGEEQKVDPGTVEIGEQILIKPGEKVPLDGKVIQGCSFLDTRALTGESLPREAAPESPVLSGCVNTNGTLIVEVTKTFGESTVSKILDLVENASSKKAHAENFITKFARVYTPAVVGAALLLAVVPPLFLGISQGEVWMEWGLPRPDLPGYLLSLCARDFGSSGILRRYRRGVAAGRIGEREQLSGGPLPKQRSWCLTRPAR